MTSPAAAGHGVQPSVCGSGNVPARQAIGTQPPVVIIIVVAGGQTHTPPALAISGAVHAKGVAEPLHASPAGHAP